MPALPDLQSQFARTMTGTEPPAALLDAIVPDGIDPARRLALHRNHYLITLTEALGATFPTLCALVGEDFFAQAARGYIASAPPAGACLFEYGEGFPAHIGRLPAARDLPYLADTGRLDWAINRAFHAADAPVLNGQALTGIAPEAVGLLRLTAHPSLSLIASPFPLLAIRAAAQPGADPAARVSLGDGEAWLMVWRHGVDVVWRALTEGEYRFAAALLQGRSLAHAATLAGDLDYVAALGAIVLSGGFTAAGLS
jgi:hypothetical protein